MREDAAWLFRRIADLYFFSEFICYLSFGLLYNISRPD